MSDSVKRGVHENESEIPRSRLARIAEPVAADPPEPPPGPSIAPPALGVQVPLEGVFLAWMNARAAAHNEPVGDHAARLLRQYWAQHDTWRHGEGSGGTAPRGAAPR